MPLSATTYYFKDIEDLLTDTFAQYVERSAAYMAKLWANTEQIMAFHDRYTEVDIDQEVCLEFHQALSDIGETLAARFALEDKLILLEAEAAQQPQPDPAR